MTLVLRPAGRGNWTPLVLQVTGQRAAPLLVRRGQFIQLAGVTYRISRIEP